MLTAASVALWRCLRVALNRCEVVTLNNLITDDTKVGAFYCREIIQITDIFVILIARWKRIVLDLRHAVKNVLIKLILECWVISVVSALN